MKKLNYILLQGNRMGKPTAAQARQKLTTDIRLKTGSLITFDDYLKKQGIVSETVRAGYDIESGQETTKTIYGRYENVTTTNPFTGKKTTTNQFVEQDPSKYISAYNKEYGTNFYYAGNGFPSSKDIKAGKMAAPMGGSAGFGYSDLKLLGDKEAFRIMMEETKGENMDLLLSMAQTLEKQRSKTDTNLIGMDLKYRVKNYITRSHSDENTAKSLESSGEAIYNAPTNSDDVAALGGVGRKNKREGLEAGGSSMSVSGLSGIGF